MKAIINVLFQAASVLIGLFFVIIMSIAGYSLGLLASKFIEVSPFEATVLFFLSAIFIQLALANYANKAKKD